jgi:uncharacterized OsmC-like protein
MNVVYDSYVDVRIAPLHERQVTLPSREEPVSMGINARVAAHYRLTEDSYVQAPTTLDFVVGATAACLSGTFAAGLSHVGQPRDDAFLSCSAVGRVEDDGGVMVLRSVHVSYRVRLDPAVDPHRAQRVHDGHVRRCPIARSIGGCVQILTNVEFV